MSRLSIQSTVLPIDPGSYTGLAWTTAGTLVVGTERPFKATAELELSLVHLPGQLEELPLAPHPACADVDSAGKPRYITDHQFPTALPDGRFVFVRDCRASAPFPPAQIVAFDLPTREEQVIFQSPSFFASGPTSWDPALSRGIGAISSGICSTVVWLQPPGEVKGLSAQIEGGGRTWQVAAGLRPGTGEDCDEQGRTNWPSWSPDGKTISFFGSPESIGKSGFARLDVPDHLYLMDAVGGDPRRVLDDLLEPRSPVWSPDSAWLAFSVLRGQNQGVWLYNPASAHRVRVSRDQMLWLAWSPQGDRLAAITDEFDPETAESHSRVIIFDVAEALVGPSS